MNKLIAVVLMVLLTTTCLYSYEPLTDDEVKSYWSTLTQDQRIDEIRKLDSIEHAEPEVVIPSLAAVLIGRDLYISYEVPEDGPQGLLIDIAGELSYEIELDGLTAKNFVPFNIKPYIVTGGVCLLVGVVGGLLIPR